MKPIFPLHTITPPSLGSFGTKGTGKPHGNISCHLYGHSGDGRSTLVNAASLPVEGASLTTTLPDTDFLDPAHNTQRNIENQEIMDTIPEMMNELNIINLSDYKTLPRGSPSTFKRFKFLPRL